jgi:glycosyltransferase involved in cell wall biosynthesis
MLPGTPRWLASRVFNPASLALACPDLRGLRRSVSLVVDQIHPDLIWAEEAFAVLLSPDEVPIVHSHLDFHFKLQSVRSRSFAAKRLRRPQALSAKRLEELEVDVCRRSAHTMCASRSEAQFLQDLGISASYLPVTGPTSPKPDYTRLSAGRLFLFGNPNTAMRAARHDLKTRIWRELDRRGLELQWHQLGKKPREGGDPSWDWVEEHFVVHGFVDDLDDLLLPGDASIMPYPFDTGGRAKFAVSAGYGVVNIAYEKTFECSEEFTHRVDCLAARDPAHFAELLDEFVSDDALRLQLAKGSRAVYERHFTMEALYPEYQRILDIVTNAEAEAVQCAS